MPAMASGDLGFCGASCIASSVKGVIVDAVDLGKRAFDTKLILPAGLTATINAIKHGSFDEWSDWIRSGGFGKDILNSLNAAYDGVIEIAKDSWDKIQRACALFNEYKSYINIGVQIIQQDYANAALNAAEEAAIALDLPVVVQGTDSQIVMAADYICKAVDGIALVAAVANGIPPPPPIGAADTLTVVDGVARKPTRLELLAMGKIKFDPGMFTGTATAAGQAVPTTTTTAKKRLVTPTVIVGASVATAIFLISR